MYLGVWVVAWGTSIAALSGGSQARSRHASLLPGIPSQALSALFIVVPIAVSVLPCSVLATAST